MATPHPAPVNTPHPEASLQVPFIVARKSPVFLVIELTALEVFMLMALLLLLVTSTSTVTTIDTIGAVLTSLSIYLLVALVLGKILLVLFIVLAWIHESYVVYEHEVIHKRGVLVLHETIFSCKNLQEVKVDQGLLGKIFNYGTVTLYNPVLREHFRLRSITDPQKYCQLIERRLTPPPEKEMPFIIHDPSP